MSTEKTGSNPHYGDDGHGAGSMAAPAQAAGDSNGTQPAGAQPSSSGRRRRRRRKGKGPAGTVPANASAVGGSDDGAIEAAPQAAPQAAPALQAPAPQQNSNGHVQGGGKRKGGRKHGGSAEGGRSGAGSSAPQPGNGANGQNRSRQARQGGGGVRARSEGPDGNREGARGGYGTEPAQDSNGNGSRRKGGKFGRRGPTSFVGPMDHSYRAANGNIADGPPSTMDFRGSNANGNINGRNDSPEAEPVAGIIREDAPSRIICFIEDLFVVAKMQETARKLGVKVQFAKAEKEALAAITDVAEADRPSLIVFDLNNANAKPLTTIPKLKAKLKRATSIIGYLQHIQGDLKLKAVEAGCDSVMPRSAFSQNLPNLLRRHGFDEKEEMIEA